MAQQGILPFLSVSGGEVANAARVLQYLRKGLAGSMQGHWDVGNPSDVCSVLYRHVVGSSSLPYGNPLAPIAPGQYYTIPSNAVVCSTQGQIDTAVGLGVAQNIVIEDGTYTRVGALAMAAAHRIYARHAGLAKLQYGFQSGVTVGAELHGLYFDVTDPANTLAPGIVHLWGTSASWVIQDCWFDGHLVNQNAVLGYTGSQGLTCERLWVRNFQDNGLRLNDNVGFASATVIKHVSDIDVANIYASPRGNSNGTGESGIMLGHKVTDGVQRIKVRNTGWQGIALNSNCRDTAFVDLDIDQVWGVVPPSSGETGVGVYIERSCHNLTFTKFVIGPDLYIGFNGEWDTGVPGTAGMNNVTISTGTISATRAATPTTPTRGIYGDAGGDRLFVDHVRFIGMNWACIDTFSMTNTPVTNFTNNDYSGRAGGAVRVAAQHASVPVASLIELVASDGPTLSPTTAFVSPAADPAPWYDSSEPGAATFLGVVLVDISGYDSTIARTATPKISGLQGGSFSAQRRTPRTWKFRAALVSGDDAGAEFGLRWLTDVLQTPACDTCQTGSIQVRLVCPPEDGTNDELGLWTSYDVALTDGPHEVQKWAPRSQQFDTDFLGGCRDLVYVEWEMQATNPFLYKTAHLAATYQITQLLDCTDICAFLFGANTSANCVSVAAPKRGTVGTVVSLHSGNGFGGVTLETYGLCPTATISKPPTMAALPRRGGMIRRRGGDRLLPGTVPPTLRSHSIHAPRPLPRSRLSPPAVVMQGGSPTSSITLTSIPAGTVVTVDSSLHTITVAGTDPATGQTVYSDGFYLLDLSGGRSVQWAEVRDCDADACFCIRALSPCASGTVDVNVWTRAREG